MQTKTLVDPSVEIVRVVSLRPGDVYKRLIVEAYGTDRLAFGVVQDVVSNGEQVAVTAIEAEVQYGAADPKIRVFKADDDLHLFPATADEVTLHFAEVRKIAERKVEEAQKAVTEKEAVLQAILSLEVDSLTAAQSERRTIEQ